MIVNKAIIENKKILIVDDDMTLCQSVEMGLTRKGAEVFTANDGATGLQNFYAQRPDLVIMDIRMPEMDGWEASRMMRLVAETPIIMLTSVNKDHEIVKGLQLGADDYVTKPFSYEVLMARIETVLRRYETNTIDITDRVYDDGYLRIDLARRNIYVNGNPVKLTSTEYRLLAYFYQHQGKRLSYDAILNAVWGSECMGTMQYVHVYTSRLRRKLEPNPKEPQYLVTEYGYGYGFNGMSGS